MPNDTENVNQSSPRSLITILVPVYNEEESIELFLKALNPHLPSEGYDWEIVFIDDGSADKTVSVVEGLMVGDERLRLIELSKNFGKEAAMTAGLDFARGDAVIPMDVDLQDPPELIGKFLSKWREGYDVVYGERSSRDDEGFFKRKSAELFYELFNNLSSVKMPANVGDFRLIDRKVVEVIKLLPERNRFMKGIFAWVGFKSIAIPYERPQRAAGTTKWNYWKLWNFALDGLMSFSTLPLRIWSYLGSIIALISLGYGGYVFFSTLLFGRDVPGYASLMTALLFFGGVQLISLGIIGEYIGRIFLEVKQRPVYVVKKDRGFQGKG